MTTSCDIATGANPGFSDLLDKVGEAIACLDHDSRFTYVNAAACRLYGRSREQLIGASIWRLFPEFLATDLPERCRQTLSEGVATECELNSPLDRWYDVRIRPRAQGLCLMSREVTDRKWARLELEDRDLALRALMSVLPVGVMLLDPSGSCLYLNERGCLMLSMTRQEALGDGWLQSVHPDDRIRAATLGATGLLSTRDSACELRILGAHSQVQWVQISIMRECNEEGQLRGHVLAMQDITERKVASRAAQPSRLMPPEHPIIPA